MKYTASLRQSCNFKIMSHVHFHSEHAIGRRNNQPDIPPDFNDEIYFHQLSDQQLAELVDDAVRNGFLDLFDEDATGDGVEIPRPRGFPNAEAMTFIPNAAAETHAD